MLYVSRPVPEGPLVFMLLQLLRFSRMVLRVRTNSGYPQNRPLILDSGFCSY